MVAAIQDDIFELQQLMVEATRPNVKVLLSARIEELRTQLKCTEAQHQALNPEAGSSGRTTLEKHSWDQSDSVVKYTPQT